MEALGLDPGLVGARMGIDLWIKNADSSGTRPREHRTAQCAGDREIVLAVLNLDGSTTMIKAVLAMRPSSRLDAGWGPP